MEAPVPQQAAPEAMAPAGSAPPVAPIEGNAEENSSLYVGDLDKDVQETHLFDVFSQVRAPRRRCVRAGSRAGARRGSAPRERPALART